MALVIAEFLELPEFRAPMVPLYLKFLSRSVHAPTIKRREA